MKHFFSFEEAVQLLHAGVCGFNFRNAVGQYFRAEDAPDGGMTVTPLDDQGNPVRKDETSEDVE